MCKHPGIGCDLSAGDGCMLCNAADEANKKAKAKAAHDIWAHWMKYMFTQGQFTPDGGFVIPFENVARWQRQMMTEFESLPAAEQKSDFEIADRFLAQF